MIRSRGFEDELDKGFNGYSLEDATASAWDDDVFDTSLFLFMFGDIISGLLCLKTLRHETTPIVS